MASLVFSCLPFYSTRCNASVLQALQRAGEPGCISRRPPIYVAFNPYFPSNAEAAAERMRLKRKLESGLVRGIYLQMGTDLKQLQEGLDFLKEVSGNQQGSSISVLGSIFLPTKRCDYICCPTTNLSVLCTWLCHINGPIPRMPPKRILAYAPLGIAALLSSQLEEL